MCPSPAHPFSATAPTAKHVFSKATPIKHALIVALIFTAVISLCLGITIALTMVARHLRVVSSGLDVA